MQLDSQTERDYLEYLRQIGILLQTFTPSSVFCLDHIHRQYIFESGERWHLIQNTLENSVLKKRDDGAKQLGAVPKRRDGRPMASTRSESRGSATDKTCWLFNMPKGCPYAEDDCNYPHVCSVMGCRRKHPAYRHGETSGADIPPRFKSDGPKSSA